MQKVLLNLTKRSTNRASPFETGSFCLFSQTLHSPLLRTRMSDVYHPRENDRSREQVLGVRFRRRIPSARRSRRTLQLLSFAQYPVITMLQQQESLLLLINHMISNLLQSEESGGEDCTIDQELVRSSAPKEDARDHLDFDDEEKEEMSDKVKCYSRILFLFLFVVSCFYAKEEEERIKK